MSDPEIPVSVLITADQETAVSLRLGGATMAEIARSLGCHRATVMRWFRRPEVAELFREGQVVRLEAAIQRLSAYLSEAIDTLAEVMRDKAAPAQTRLSAAHAILARALDVAGARHASIQSSDQDVHSRIRDLYGLGVEPSQPASAPPTGATDVA